MGVKGKKQCGCGRGGGRGAWCRPCTRAGSGDCWAGLSALYAEGDVLPVVAPAACSPGPSSTKHLCCAEPEALTGAVVAACRRSWRCSTPAGQLPWSYWRSTLAARRGSSMSSSGREGQCVILQIPLRVADRKACKRISCCTHRVCNHVDRAFFTANIKHT